MRRFGMLLCMVVLLAVVLAVPAMAHENTWVPLGAETEITSGNYYLEGELHRSITIGEGVEVTICLNGQHWYGDGSARPLTISGGSVTVCDCASAGQPGTIHGANVDEGGVCSVSGGSFTLESGTLYGSKNATYGGAVAMNVAAQQHSTPEISTTYYKDAEGNYTDAEGNPVSEANRVVKTDYASTFHAGVLAAAKAAVEAQASVTAMETATIGTKGKGAGGASFNFVRNIVITDKKGNVVGTHTDNHRDVAAEDWKGFITTYNAAYESNVDHTMQLVKFTMQGGKTLIFANFQTHPHLGADPNTPRVHADLVGVFREELSDLTGADVIYFSGAGGDVNPRDTHMDGNGYAKEDLWEYLDYGTDLAVLANSAVYAPVKTSADTWDVAVAGSTHQLEIRDDLVGMEQADADALLLRAQQIQTDGYVGAGTSTAWETYVKPYAMGQRIYSSYHANALLKREAEFEKGNTYWDVNISVFSLGPVAVVNAPYEMFQVNGQQIKGISVAADGTVTNTGRDDGFEMVLIASKSNGSDGYIPSAAGYANGGYATDISWFKPGTGEYLVDHYHLLLKQLSE